jgi:hypothetical protein
VGIRVDRMGVALGLKIGVELGRTTKDVRVGTAVEVRVGIRVGT